MEKRKRGGKGMIECEGGRITPAPPENVPVVFHTSNQVNWRLTAAQSTLFSTRASWAQYLEKTKRRKRGQKGSNQANLLWVMPRARCGPTSVRQEAGVDARTNARCKHPPRRLQGGVSGWSELVKSFSA